MIEEKLESRYCDNLRLLSILLVLTGIYHRNFSLVHFMPVPPFPLVFVVIFVSVPFWLHLLHLPLILMTHLLFLRHHVNTSSKCQKILLRTRLCTYENLSHEVLFLA